MVIGGTDDVMEIANSDVLRDLVSRMMKTRWPGVVVVPGHNETFFYKSQDAKDRWDLYGAAEDMPDELILVIYQPHQLTIVHGGSKEQARISNEILTAIRHNWWATGQGTKP